MLKHSDNPPSRPLDIGSIAQLAERWTVVKTKSRAEKAMAWVFQAEKTAYFLPMTRRVTFSGGRKRIGVYPLFAGYIFVNASTDSWRFGLASRHLASIIAVVDQGQLGAELSVLERALETDAFGVAFPHIAAGNRYRVTAGPLAGIVGIAVEIQGATHVVLSISILGQGAALPVEASLLATVD